MKKQMDGLAICGAQKSLPLLNGAKAPESRLLYGIRCFYII
jgi:hypothetical protein